MQHPRSLSRRVPILLSAMTLLLALIHLSTNVVAETETDTSRIVSVGGDVTEIIYALGSGDDITAVDVTSVHPPEALRTKQNIGYMRALSSEGVLSMRPSVIIASDGAGPPEVIKALKAASITYLSVDDSPTPDSVPKKIEAIAKALGKVEQGRGMITEFKTRMSSLAARREKIAKQKSVLFILGARGGRAIIGGAETKADSVIKLAGGRNAATGVVGFKPLSDEALIAMAPDAIIVMKRGGRNSIHQDVLDLRGVKLTPAAENDQIILMDGQYLIGFGPRLPQAANDLMAKLYPSTNQQAQKPVTEKESVN